MTNTGNITFPSTDTLTASNVPMWDYSGSPLSSEDIWQCIGAEEKKIIIGTNEEVIIL